MVMASDKWQGGEALVPGTRIGRYQIGQKIGVGGVGSVYEATHLELKKKVAIKVLSPWVANEPEVRMRFLREGESTSRLRHPNVVDVYDVGEEGAIAYMVMEFLEGVSLSDLLRKHGRLMPSVIADVLVPISSALHSAHKSNVIHRDLKPSNIFLAHSSLGDTSPKLLDFGISKLVDQKDIEHLTLTGTVLGTPSYMSPEQADGGVNVDARSDQYSLGVIAYLCATGHRPFVADSMYQLLHKIIRGDFPRPSEVCSDIPERLEAVILKAMATKPESRYPTVLAFGRAMLQFADPRLSSAWSPLFGVEIEEVRLDESFTGGNSVLSRVLSDTSPDSAFRSVSMALSAGVGGAWTKRLDWKSVGWGLSLLAVLLLVGLGLAKPNAWLASPENATLVGDVPTSRAEIVSGASVTHAVGPDRSAGQVLNSSEERFTVVAEVEPRWAQFRLDGQLVGIGRIEAKLPKSGKAHTLEMVAKGYETKKVRFEDEAPQVSKFILVRSSQAREASSKAGNKRQDSTRLGGSQRNIRKPNPRNRQKLKPKKGTNDALILQ